MKRKIIKGTWWLTAIILILIAVFLTTVRIYVHRIEQSKSDLETLISKRLGCPVQVQKVQTGWRWFEPIFVLQNLQIYNCDQSRVMLTVNQLNMGISLFSSLFSGHIVPNIIQVSGLNLSLVQKENGEYIIAGMPAFASNNSDKEALTHWLSWVLTEKLISFKDVHIDWAQNTKKLSLDIPELNFVIRHQHHVLWGDFIFKQPDVARVHIAGTLSGSEDDLNKMQIRLYLQAQQIKLPLWLASYDVRGWHIKNGYANVSIWAHWNNNQWQQIRTKVDLSQAQVISPQQKPWAIQAQGLILAATQNQNIWTLTGQVQKLILNKINLTPMPLEFAYQKLANQQSFQVSAISLTSLIALAKQAQLLNTAQLNQIQTLQPNGNLKNCYLHYDNNFILNTDLENISFVAYQKIPACKHLTGNLQYSTGEGFFKLDATNLILSFNKIFRSNLMLETALADIHWKITDNGLVIHGQHIFGSNADGNVYGRGVLFLPQSKNSPVWLSLQAYANIKNIKNKSVYLPVNVISPKLLTWLDKAILDGKNLQSQVIINGSMDNFPFDHHDGTFIADSTLMGFNLKYLPNWPVLQNIDGNLIFLNRSMHLLASHAELYQSTLSNIVADIPYMGDKNPVILSVSGNIAGDFNDSIKFLKDTPMWGDSLRKISSLKGDGKINYNLAMNIPLNNTNQTLQISGSVKFIDDGIELNKLWLLDHLNGDMSFKQDQFVVHNLSTNMFENPAHVVVTSTHTNQYDQNIIKIKGSITSKFLHKLLPKGLHEYFKGGSKFHILANLYQGANVAVVPKNQIQISSNLKGIEINLPEPFTKLANNIQRAIFTFTYGPTQPLLLDFFDGKFIRGGATFNDQDKFAIDKGIIVFNQSNYTLPSQQGIYVSGSLPTLDVPNWIKFIKQNQAPNTTPGHEELSFIKWQSIVKGINLKIANLILPSFTINNIEVGLKRGNNAEVFNLTSDLLSGEITYPDDFPRSALILNLRNLNWKFAKEDSKLTIEPYDLPPIVFHSDSVVIDNKNIGSVSFQINKIGHGVNINGLDVGGRAYHLRANGDWTKIATVEGTTLNGNVTSNDVANLLQQFGLAPSVECNNALASFNLHWPKGPMNFALANASGSVDLRLQNGTFTGLSESTNREIAFGNIMSLLSYQSIVQQFKLNGRGLTNKGFNFTVMKGNFVFKNGNAFTQQLVVHSPIAEVVITGRIGFATQDYDMNVSVTPKNILGSLPIIATVVGTPVAGLAVWLGEKIISPAVEVLTTFHYHISGSWHNPQITKM